MVEGVTVLALQGWSVSRDPLAALCAAVEEVVGDIQEDSAGVEEVVLVLEAGVLSTLVAARASPSVWLEEVVVVVLEVVALEVVALVVVALVVALAVVVLAVEVLAVVVLVVVVLAVQVVLEEVDMEVVSGLPFLLVVYMKSPSTRAFCNPSMWRLTLKSKK